MVLNMVFKSLFEVADVIDPHPSHRAPPIEKNGIPFVGIGDVDEYGKIDIDKSRKVSATVLLEHKNRYVIDDNSIGYGRVATVGKVIRLKKHQDLEYVLSPTLALINPKTDLIDPDYLYYQLLDEFFSNQVKMNLTGSTRDSLGIKILRKISISYPPISVQKKIGNTLSSIDEKIELNIKINKNLEELVQTLYKRWFVDFEFPNEEGKPYKSSGGEMIDTELGMIPKDWEVRKLKDLFNFTGGFAFKGNRIDNNGKFKIITIKNVQNGIMDLTRFDTLEKLPTKVKESQILEIGDIIISLTGNVGRACMVVSENCLLNQRVEKINAINKDYEGFCYFYIRSNETYNKMLALAKGSAQQNLSPVELSNLKVAFNQNNKSIFKFFNNLRLQLLNYQIQNIKLANIRDLLLPKLMSGEIEVPDME